MNILITTPTYPPFNSGLGNVVQIQAKLLSQLGHDVTIATGGQSGVIRFDEVANAKVIEFAISGADYIPRPIRGEKDKYAEFLQHGNFDVILLNAWQNWATDLALNYLDVIESKVFVYSHCISTNSFIGANFIRSLASYLFWRPYWFGLSKKIKKLRGIIFLSSSGCDSRFDDLQLSLKLKVKYWIIPNAIPTYAEEAMCLSSKAKDVRTQITSVASYDWFKGHDFVIRAYANSSAKNVIPLKIFGQKFTKYTEELKALANAVGVLDEFIEFNENLSGSELMDEYLKSLVFIGGSYSECQPLVILDAMAAGVPFISRKSGSIPMLEGGYSVADHFEASKMLDVLVKDENVWIEKNQAGRNYISNNHTQDRVKNILFEFLEGIG